MKLNSPYLISIPIALACIVAMLATDIYLPAVPTLHETLGGTPVMAQYTLASFMAAFAIGQLVVGALGDRYDKRTILLVSLAAVTAVSLAAALAPDMASLIGLRALQGLAAAACVALAPAMIRELGDEDTASRLLGFISSVESIVPAAAPAIGVWLIGLAGWQGSFVAVAAAALLTALVFAVMPRTAAASAPPAAPLAHPVVVYWNLVKARRFMVYTLGHGLGVGALTTFIFAAPYVLTALYGRDMTSFAWMQVVLVTAFVIAVNLGPWLARELGADNAIVCGGLVQTIGGLSLLTVTCLDAAPSTATLTLAMMPVFVGQGLRAGPGFTRAMDTSGGPAGSTGALMVFLVAAVIAAGTAAVAPLLALGGWALGLAVAAQALLGVVIMPLARRGEAWERPQTVRAATAAE
ncbi:MAG: MFS transporter [Rhodospirillaceae bacterium]|nr:MFS transporter [Rhodospirillaceae bacterium]